jgi:hypothetical protein
MPTLPQAGEREYTMLTTVVHKGLSKSKRLGKVLTRPEQAVEPAPVALMSTKRYGLLAIISSQHTRYHHLLMRKMPRLLASDLHTT